MPHLDNSFSAKLSWVIGKKYEAIRTIPEKKMMRSGISVLITFDIHLPPYVLSSDLRIGDPKFTRIEPSTTRITAKYLNRSCPTKLPNRTGSWEI